jgi:hypothetical protein
LPGQAITQTNQLKNIQTENEQCQLNHLVRETVQQKLKYARGGQRNLSDHAKKIKTSS